MAYYVETFHTYIFVGAFAEVMLFSHPLIKPEGGPLDIAYTSKVLNVFEDGSGFETRNTVFLKAKVVV